MLTVQEATDVTRPSQLRHLWHSLWSRTPRASFRQTPEFLEAWPVDRWRVLIVSAWQRPIGILPLCERTVRRVLGTTRVLSLPESPWGFCPGPVGPHPLTTLTAAVRHLVDRDDSWDVLELPEVVANQAIPSRIPRVFDSGRIVMRNTPHTLHGLELPATMSQFWADRDAAARQRWRELEAQRSLRRNEQFLRFRPGGAWHGDTDRDWEFLDQCEHVVQRQTSSAHGTSSRTLLAQLRDLHASAVDFGCADLALWLCDSRPAAFAYNFHCRSRVETALLMADPEIPHATDRLMGMMLRDEMARGDRWHVFLPNSVLGATVDPTLWHPVALRETTLAHKRQNPLRKRLRHWLGGGSRRNDESAINHPVSRY